MSTLILRPDATDHDPSEVRLVYACENGHEVGRKPDDDFEEAA